MRLSSFCCGRSFPPPAFGSSPNLELLATEVMSKPPGVSEEDNGSESVMQTSLRSEFTEIR